MGVQKLKQFSELDQLPVIERLKGFGRQCQAFDHAQAEILPGVGEDEELDPSVIGIRGTQDQVAFLQPVSDAGQMELLQARKSATSRIGLGRSRVWRTITCGGWQVVELTANYGEAGLERNPGLTELLPYECFFVGARSGQGRISHFLDGISA